MKNAEAVIRSALFYAWKDMVIDMKYTPSSQNKRASAIAAILLVVAAAAYILSLTEVASPALLQFITLIFITAAVYVLVRYKYTTVTYVISSDSNGDYDFTAISNTDFIVYKSQGKREGIMECRLSLDLLKAAVPLVGGRITGKQRRELTEKYGKFKIYNYIVSVRPENVIALVFDDDGDVSVIIVEPDKAMRRYLEEAAAE